MVPILINKDVFEPSYSYQATKMEIGNGLYQGQEDQTRAKGTEGILFVL